MELAKQLYGLPGVAEVKEFVSYDDRNFYLKTAASQGGAARCRSPLPSTYRSSPLSCQQRRR